MLSLTWCSNGVRVNSKSAVSTCSFRRDQHRTPTTTTATSRIAPTAAATVMMMLVSDDRPLAAGRVCG